MFRAPLCIAVVVCFQIKGPSLHELEGVEFLYTVALYVDAPGLAVQVSSLSGVRKVDFLCLIKFMRRVCSSSQSHHLSGLSIMRLSLAWATSKL